MIVVNIGLVKGLETSQESDWRSKATVYQVPRAVAEDVDKNDDHHGISNVDVSSARGFFDEVDVMALTSAISRYATFARRTLAADELALEQFKPLQVRICCKFSSDVRFMCVSQSGAACVSRSIQFGTRHVSSMTECVQSSFSFRCTTAADASRYVRTRVKDGGPCKTEACCLY